MVDEVVVDIVLDLDTPEEVGVEIDIITEHDDELDVLDSDMKEVIIVLLTVVEVEVEHEVYDEIETIDVYDDIEVAEYRAILIELVNGMPLDETDIIDITAVIIRAVVLGVLL